MREVVSEKSVATSPRSCEGGRGREGGRGWTVQLERDELYALMVTYCGGVPGRI